MKNTVLTGGNVLDTKGSPLPGYSTKSVLRYDRGHIKALPWRLKEWDFYQISNATHCLQFTFGHAAYAGQLCVMLFDFSSGTPLLEKSRFLVLPFSSLNMPLDAEQDHTLTYDKKGLFMQFETKGDIRTLRCVWDDITSEITLIRKNPHSLVINVPFKESEKAFYYNHKINCMTAEGFIKYGDDHYVFDEADSFGILDWGRGVWPFSNEWYWSNGCGYLDGKLFGFNLGCGFGDTSHATENILFYNNEFHKLGNVEIICDSTDYMKPWRLVDEDGRLDLTLTPTYDRTTKTKLLWVDNECHQMFGEFTGTAVLDDGTTLAISKLYSFAEHAINNW